MVIGAKGWSRSMARSSKGFGKPSAPSVPFNDFQFQKIPQIYYKIIELFLQLVRVYKHLSGFTVSLSMHSTVVIEIDHYPSWVELS